MCALSSGLSIWGWVDAYSSRDSWDIPCDLKTRNVLRSHGFWLNRRCRGMEQTRTRALCPRTPMDAPDAMLGLALGLADGAFPLAARVACARALDRTRADAPDSWYRCIVTLLRGVGMRMFGTPLSGCSIRVRELEVADRNGNHPPADDAHNGAWICAPGGQQPRLGLDRWHWGDVPDDADDARLAWCGLDSSVSAGVAAITAAACISAHVTYDVVHRIATGSVDGAIRHLYWSARAIGRIDGDHLVDLAWAIASEPALSLDDVDDWLTGWWCERL